MLKLWVPPPAESSALIRVPSVFLRISSLTGEVMKNGDIRQIMNEGMPTYRSPYDKGRLIVQFSVKFPEKIDPANVGKLEALLPPRDVSHFIVDDIEPQTAEVLKIIFTIYTNELHSEYVLNINQ